MRILLIAAALLALASPALAQDRFAWVNVDYILANNSGYQAAAARFEAFSQEATDSAQARRSRLADRQQTAFQAMDTASEANRDAMGASLQLAYDAMTVWERETAARLDSIEQTSMAEVTARVQEAINAVAAREGLTFVLSNGGNGASYLLVAPVEFNVSDHVLQQLGDTPPQPVAPFVAPTEPEKLALLNLDYVLANSSAFRSAESEARAYEQAASDSITARRTRMTGLYAALDTASEATRGAIIAELQPLANTDTQWQQQLGARVQAYRQERITAALDAVQAAIDAVAAREGYTYVLSNGGGVTSVVVAPDAANIADTVLLELGDTPPAPPPPAN